MKPLVLAATLCTPLFGACVVHYHFHEASRVAPTEARAAENEPTAAATTARVQGIVRDASGSPARAVVAVVGTGGSITQSTGNDGRFDLTNLHWTEFVLRASTDDGRAAIARSRSGARDVELVLQAGGTLAIDLQGTQKARCAIVLDGMLVEDFTLRAAEPAHVVLPPGEVRVRLYDGDRTLEERHFHVVVGETTQVQLAPHS